MKKLNITGNKSIFFEMIYTLKNVHPAYRILDERIIDENNILHIQAKSDVDLPRFQFLKKFSPQTNLNKYKYLPLLKTSKSSIQ